MYALFKKEINNFLSSLIGIMVVVVFLLITTMIPMRELKKLFISFLKSAYIIILLQMILN